MDTIIEIISNIVGGVGSLLSASLSFLISCGKFLGFGLNLFTSYFNLILHIFPNFLLPYISIFIVIRLIRFILKRGNPIHHSSASATPTPAPVLTKTKTVFDDESMTFEEKTYTRKS